MKASELLKDPRFNRYQAAAKLKRESMLQCTQEEPAEANHTSYYHNGAKIIRGAQKMKCPNCGFEFPFRTRKLEDVLKGY